MKKISILLVISIILSNISFVSAFAADTSADFEMYMYETYEDMKGGCYANDLFNSYAGKGKRIEEKEGDKVVNYAYSLTSYTPKEVDTPKEVHTDFVLEQKAAYEDLFIQADFKFTNIENTFAIKVYHPYLDYVFTPLTIDSSYSINGTSTVLEKNEWYNISVHVKLSERKYDVYLDGEMVVSNKTTPDTLTTITRINFCLSGQTATTASNFIFDNVCMYNAPAYRNDFNDYNILTMDKYYFDEEVKTYDEFLKNKKFILTDTLTVSDNGVITKNGITKKEVDSIIKGNHTGYSYMDYDEFYGVILLSNTEITSTNYPEHYKYKLRSHIYYNRPTVEEVSASLKKSHPRIILTNEKVSDIKTSLSSGDEYVVAAYNRVKSLADNVPKFVDGEGAYKDAYTYSINNGSMGQADSIEAALQNVALMYKLTNNKTYLEWIEKVLNLLCDPEKYPDWGQTHFSASYITTSVSLAYDWCYNDLAEETKRKVEEALYKNYLLEYAAHYMGITGKAPEHYMESGGNTNTVTGVANILATLCLYDKEGYEDISKFVFKGALYSVENSFEFYVRNEGAIPESVSYIGMCIHNLCIIMNALETSLDMPLNYKDTRHLDRTAYYLLGIGGPMGYNDFHDTTSVQEYVWEKPNLGSMSQILYLGNTYNKSITGAYKNLCLYNGVGAKTAWEIIWGGGNYPTEELVKDQLFRGLNDMVFFRNSYYDTGSLYLSAHAGDNYVSHGHNDGGTFVFQALGKEWFCDLGAEKYEIGAGVTTMNTYRVRTEGHNLYIINPRPDSTSQKPGVANNNRIYAGQALNGRAEVIDFRSGDSGGFIIYDMSDLYREDVISATRGFRLTNNRQAMVLRDEITPKEANSKIMSFLHTTGDIEIINDELAIVTKGAEKCAVLLSTNATDAKLSVMKAESVLEGFTQPVGAWSNDMYRKIAVTLTASDSVYINLDIIPLYNSKTEIIRHNDATSTWKLTGESYKTPEIKELFHDGVKQNIDPRNRIVTLYVDNEKHTPGVLTATAEDGIKVEIENATSFMDSGKVVLTDKETNISSTYTVNFLPTPVNINNCPGNSDIITAMTYEGSNTVTGAHAKENGKYVVKEANVLEIMTDNDIKTYFDKYIKNSELIITLDKTRVLDGIYMMFVAGGRTYCYDVGFSIDGINYSYIRNTDHSGSGACDYRTFSPVAAKYVKIILNGNDGGTSTRTCPADVSFDVVDVDNYSLIGNAEEFEKIRENPSGNYYLVSDITLPDTYVPIPDFSGKLIGYDITENKKIIRNINVNINLPETDNVGLFSKVSGDAMELSHIAVKGSITGNLNVGGIAGLITTTSNDSKIEYCENYATVSGNSSVGGIFGRAYDGCTGLTLQYLSNIGNITTDSSTAVADVGGIFGIANTSFSGSFLRNIGNVTSLNGQNAGGIAGRTYSSIQKAYNLGNVSGISGVGGITGSMPQSNRSVIDSYNCGDITATSSAAAIIGSGTSGRKIKMANCYNTGIISNNNVKSTSLLTSFNETSVDSGSDCYYSDEIVTDSIDNTHALNKMQLREIASFAGFDNTIWKISDDSVFPYPQLIWENSDCESFITKNKAQITFDEISDNYSPASYNTKNGENETSFNVKTAGGIVEIAKGTNYIAFITETIPFKFYKLEEQGIEINGTKYKSSYTDTGKYLMMFKNIKNANYRPYSIYSFQGKEICVYGEQKSI